MNWSDIPRDPPARLLRQFAGLWLAFFLGLAAWQGRLRGLPAVIVCVTLAVSVGGVGLVRPQAVRPLFVGWMMLAFPIGWLVSHVALAVVFYGLITPLAVAFRLAGRDLLALKRREVRSYWQPKPQPTDVRRYFKQF